MKHSSELSLIIKSLVEMAEQDDGENYFDIVTSIAFIFPKNLIEQLQQLVKNPTYDGDVICKSYRAELLTMGIATRVCCNGQQGYTGGKYIAYSILNKLIENNLLKL